MNDTLFDKAFVKVKLLSTIFRTNESRYLSPAYQEAEVRKDFIDKFFAALGWDVNHDEQTDSYAQEVKVERGVETRTVDYAFFLKPNYRDNTLICLINQATYLFKRQLEKLEQSFLREGGITERLYQARQEIRHAGFNSKGKSRV